MATFQIEIDDATGAPKDLPDALKKHVDALVDTGFKARHAELRTKVEKELGERHRGGNELSESERARIKALEEETSGFQIAEAERKKPTTRRPRRSGKTRRPSATTSARPRTPKRTRKFRGATSRLRDMARSEIASPPKRWGRATSPSTNSPSSWAPISTSMPTSSPS
jgi:hypothetical protein